MPQDQDAAARAAAALADYGQAFNPRFETVLRDALAGAPQRIRDATLHGALNGGKRLRPFLLQRSAALFGVQNDAAFLAAAALEAVHCYSLVHDDLPAMDDDDLRRGQPTVHIAFDEATAILAGDTLLTLAFQLIGQIEPAELSRDLNRQLTLASGPQGMLGGQMLDLEAEGRFSDGIPKHHDADGIRTLQAMKTGALICVACTMGARVGNATTDQHNALETFGQHLGYAFQIADDLLDHRGDTASLGKAAGKDAAAGKATLVGLMGSSKAEAMLEDTVAAARATLSPFGTSASGLHDLAAFVAHRDA